MKELEYIPDNNQLDLTDRVAIEVGQARKETFTKIAKRLRKHPITTSREIKANRTYLPAEYPFENDCKYARSCHKKNLCGVEYDACHYECRRCPTQD